MKVLIISYGGLAEDARVIFREYARQGIELYIISPSKIAVNKTYYPSGFLEYEKEKFKENYIFFAVDLLNSGKKHYFKMFNPWQMFKVFKKIKPDIIHVFNEYSSTHLTEAIFLRNLLYKKTVPVLPYVFENIEFTSAKLKPELSSYFLRNIARRILRPIKFIYNLNNVSGVVGANNDSLKIIRNTGLNVPMKRIFPAIDLNLFYKKDKLECRNKIGLNPSKKYAGYFGRIVEGKGLQTLILAIKKLTDYDLIILGGGLEKNSYEDKIKQFVKEQGMEEKVHFIKGTTMDKLNDYYNSLDVFVLASETLTDWKEQYGRVLVEAMSCQLAIVGSSSGAIAEVLEGYPRALIFKEKDIEGLADKIKKSEHLSFPQDYDNQKFLEKFSVSNFVKENINFYNKLLNTNGKN